MTYTPSACEGWGGALIFRWLLFLEKLPTLGTAGSPGHKRILAVATEPHHPLLLVFRDSEQRPSDPNDFQRDQYAQHQQQSHGTLSPQEVIVLRVRGQPESHRHRIPDPEDRGGTEREKHRDDGCAEPV